MNTPARKRLAWLHTWSGLVFGIAIVMLGITGAGLVLRPELDSLVNHHLLKVPACHAPLPLDTQVARAGAAHPGKVRNIELTAGPTNTTAVKFANMDYVYVSPCSGKVLGVQNQYGGFFGTLDWLHRFLFAGHETGRPIAGWINLVFLLSLIIGGIVLWWPRSKTELRRAIRFDVKLPGIARTLSLHKIIGLYTSVLLLVITLTAIPIGFLPVKNLIYHLTGYQPLDPPTSTVNVGVLPMPLQQVWRETQREFPHITWASIDLPQRPEDAIRIEILEPGMPHKNAKSFLYLDQYSGRVLYRIHYKALNVGRKLYLYSIAFHSALVGGLPYQILLLLACLGIPVQAWSGFSPWLQRRLRSRRPPKIAVQVASREMIAPDIVALELIRPDGRPLPPFSAGAHIDVHPAPGIQRQYSLCGSPRNHRRYRIAVLQVADSRGGSIAMHALQAGDRLEISAPRNFFALVPGTSPCVLFAGGIGITPILCMAQALNDAGVPFALHYCVRSMRQAAFIDELKDAPWHDKVTVHISELGERIDFREVLADCQKDTHIYVCGPVGFTEAATDAASEAGLDASHVHFEYFKARTRDDSDNVPFDVRIASTGQIIHIPADRSITDILIERGFDIPVSCEEGICGTCLTGVVSGDVEHHDVILDEAERVRNRRLTPCCSRARGGTLVLDL